MTLRTKLEVGAYIVIAALSVPSYFWALRVNQGLFQDFLINIAATCVGAALLFFLLNRFFGLDSDSSGHIEELIQRIASKDSFLINNTERRQRFPLQDAIQMSKQVDALGNTLSNFLESYRDKILARVQQGAKIRLMIIDPSCKEHNTIIETYPNLPFESDMMRSVIHIKSIILSLTNSSTVKGSFEVRLINWRASCTMVIFDGKSPSGRAVITINNPNYSTPVRDRAHFILSKSNDARWFDYFSNEFETLWRNARPWNH